MRSVLTLIYDEAKRIWQYRWLSLVVACGVFIAAAIYIERLPNLYYTTGQIYVSGQTALSQLSEGVAVKGDRGSQAYLVRKTMLNGNKLDEVISRLPTDFDLSTPATREDAKEFIRDNVLITSGDDDGFVNINFRDTNPTRARDVAQGLVNLFVSANVGQNQQGLQNAETFLTAQINDYDRKLRVAEQAVTAYQLAHFAILGGNNGAGDLSARLAAAQSAVDAARAAPVRSSNGVPQGESSDITAARARLAALRSQFTDQYPDVVTARRDLDRLIANHAAGSGVTSSGGHSGVAQSGLGAAEARLARLRALQAQAPEISAQYAELSRNAEIIRTNYQTLLTRREAARFSQAMDRTDDHAQYRVTIEPHLPYGPSGPNRQLFLLFAVAGAIGSGLIAAYMLAAVRGIFVAPRELEQAFDLPVVGTISWEQAWQNKPHRGRFTSVYFGLLALTAVVVAAAYANGFTFSKLAAFNFGWFSNIFR